MDASATLNDATASFMQFNIRKPYGSPQIIEIFNLNFIYAENLFTNGLGTFLNVKY